MYKSMNRMRASRERRCVRESLAPVDWVSPVSIDGAATGYGPTEKVVRRVALRLENRGVARVILDKVAHEREVSIIMLPSHGSPDASRLEVEVIGEPGRVEETLHCLRQWGLLAHGILSSAPAGTLQAG